MQRYSNKHTILILLTFGFYGYDSILFYYTTLNSDETTILWCNQQTKNCWNFLVPRGSFGSCKLWRTFEPLHILSWLYIKAASF